MFVISAQPLMHFTVFTTTTAAAAAATTTTISLLLGLLLPVESHFLPLSRLFFSDR